MATLSTQVTFENLAVACEAHGLRISGVSDVSNNENLSGLKSLVLLSPDEPEFWNIFSASSEYRDQAIDPMDRWSKRIIGQLTERHGGTAFYPFGGPPYHPFYTWALNTGRVFVSPVQFLVDHETGLFVSFRGAIGFQHTIIDPRPLVSSPCLDCSKPCITTCPADALDESEYDVAKCKSFLQNEPQSCSSNGCAARRACPYSDKAGRPFEHAKFHMRAFMGG